MECESYMKVNMQYKNLKNGKFKIGKCDIHKIEKL